MSKEVIVLSREELADLIRDVFLSLGVDVSKVTQEAHAKMLWGLAGLDKWTPIKEAAAITGYSPSHLYNLGKSDQVRLVRLGTLVHMGDLEEYEPNPTGWPKGKPRKESHE